MLVAITGHTSGIGAAIYNYFCIPNNKVIGFSKSTGYDISDELSRQAIIDQSKDCDIFVNNAYSNFDDSQLILLTDLFNLWRGRADKLIINVSTKWTTDNHIYCLSKAKQDKFCHDRVFNKPPIINLKPGYVDTPRVKNITKKKMPTSDLVEILDFALKHRNKYLISSITFE